MYKNYTINIGVPGRRIYQLLLIMRLTTVILLVTVMQVSATSFAQEITLAEKNASLKQLFARIQAQSKYDFVYTAQLLRDAKPVDINVKSTPLRVVLDKIFEHQPLTYTIDDHTIVIKAKERSFFDRLTDYINAITISGHVYNQEGTALPGASVRIDGTKLRTTTDGAGRFSISNAPNKGKLIITYIGYKPDTIAINDQQDFDIRLTLQANTINEVSIVSTGYQDLPKERATGSFELITKEQLQHSTDPNLLRRLEGITTSMDFRNDLRVRNSSLPNAKESPLTNLTIRGKNTLNYNSQNTSGQVLVVIDGIASPYSIDKVNPNDVESITILKDAAAASIWGSRAANGVIVVKTKKGGYNRATQVTFNSNVSVTEKVDLFYNKTMSISDFVDAQILQFNTANMPLPAHSISALYGQEPVSPVAEILNSWKFENTLTEAQATAQLNALRSNDIRRDYDNYFLRNSVNQSYSLAVDGGSERVNYRLSGGYDRTINNTKQSGADRLALGYNLSARPLKNLELQGNITFNIQNTSDQAAENAITGVTNSTFYPYTMLADAAGNPLELTKIYRPGLVSLLESEYGNRLLSFRYRPLEDISEGYNKIKAQNVNINLGATYRIIPAISAQLSYNYNSGRNDDNTLYRQNSFYMRNLINYFTTSPYSSDPMTFEDVPDFVRGIPVGGQYQTSLSKSTNQTLRGQLNFEKSWADKHQVSAIAGTDITENKSITNANIYYGYDEHTLKSDNDINFSGLIPILFAEDFNGYNGENVPKVNNPFLDSRIRTFSWFSNAAYTYDRRYTLSASIRKDISSEFGRGTNQKGTPYFSFGGSWNIDNEAFYHFDLVPVLKLRATFGYNGNVNPLVVARPLITYIDYGNYDVPYAATQPSGSVSNSLLRPEKTGIWNLGVDFGLKGNRISGSIEYYNKKTKDLLAGGALDPSTGFTNATYNTGNLTGYGMDITLNSVNIEGEKFRWTSNFLFSYNRVKVTKLYAATTSTAGGVVSNSSGSYNEGFDLSRLFGYRWAGLDPATGDPRGYLNGNTVSISNDAAGNTNYRNIQNAAVTEAHYFGSAVPVFFGSLRNTFSYKSFSVSANLQYKLGYFTRRPLAQVVNYSALYTSRGALQGVEFADRWQQPGDEARTNVPSAVVSSGSQNRDNFYYYSDINVLKGDHIRIQEINFSYGLETKKNWFIKNPRIYANLNNLGILWRANKLGIDPEVFDYPTPRSYSLGLSANF